MLLSIDTATSEKFYSRKKSPEPWFEPEAGGLWGANAAAVLYCPPPMNYFLYIEAEIGLINLQIYLN